MGDLFDVSANKQLNKDSFTFSDNGDYAYFTRTVSNNGVLGYVEYLDDEHKIPGGCIAVGMLGMRFFYMEKDFYAGQFTKRLIPKGFNLSRSSAVFFTALLNKFEPLLKQGLVRDFERVLTAQSIDLPSKHGKIDLDYIEAIVAALEDEHLKKLVAYLEVSGFDNLTLSDDENLALQQVFDCNWKSFRIGDVFEKLPGKKAAKKDVRKWRDAEFNVPAVYCKFGDNGIMYWGREGEFATFENCISIVYNGEIAAGKVYAQKEPTGILAESYMIRLKDGPQSHNLNLFLTACLEKVLYPKYSRDFLATWNEKVEDDEFFMPVDASGSPAFGLMEAAVSGMMKLVIEDATAFIGQRSSSR
ncbi:restriction endonuclease subunit S [Arcanobacterium canis]|uniref:Restriction endonuclease subunit S n=1 Tax=Arcanobacterium canis TaxID=999183 RepID=A0ABY8G1B6_9ACTO|nr:restriction endonuclease subunit S [Arcanobacterium canis]WFM83171.1 restriction endonuclease subunit S [Arcanobacterium canis]